MPGNSIWGISDKWTNLLMVGKGVQLRKLRRETRPDTKGPFPFQRPSFPSSRWQRGWDRSLRFTWNSRWYCNRMFRMLSSPTGNKNNRIWQKEGGKARSQNPNDSEGENQSSQMHVSSGLGTEGLWGQRRPRANGECPVRTPPKSSLRPHLVS